jgi:acyl dehydratase
MAGRYFDEWQVGDRVSHSITRTVTETDNLLISTLTHNPQPMHLDHEVAAQSEFKRPIINSVFTFGLMIGVSVADTTLGTLVANLGYDKVVFPNPVFIGDTLRSESECIAVRESKSRPNAGIVTWAHRSFNQRRELVCECTRTALLLKKPPRGPDA